MVATVRELTKAGFRMLPNAGPLMPVISPQETACCLYLTWAKIDLQRGVGVVAGHTDAPTAVLKPNSTKQTVEGYRVVGRSASAGGLLELWWDRDLGIGGRILRAWPRPSLSRNSRQFDAAPHRPFSTLAPHFGRPSQGLF